MPREAARRRSVGLMSVASLCLRPRQTRYRTQRRAPGSTALSWTTLNWALGGSGSLQAGVTVKVGMRSRLPGVGPTQRTNDVTVPLDSEESR